MFLPTTHDEMKKLGWDKCDVILVTGDAYIDSPYIGVAVIGRVLTDAGYKVGIIAQPLLGQTQSSEAEQPVDFVNDIQRLGEPRLFWGVTGGCVDSMVANYTATKKPRRSDDFTPGGMNIRRPNRAVVIYSNLIRQYFKNTVPIVLGGIEASLRRLAHFDYWTEGIRKSILFDAKADYMVYGMGEKAIVELADELKIQSLEPKDDPGNTKQTQTDIKGICYISKTPVEGYIELPAYDEVIRDKQEFLESFKIFYDNNDPGTSKGLMQKQDTRYLIQNPPAELLSTQELDHVYELPFEYDAHPYYSNQGNIKALETIRFSINSHRGCFGECNFCAITTHQGRIVTSRSMKSVLEEAQKITQLPGFKGYIYDVGGPTANMYAMGCTQLKNSHCKTKQCIFPGVCPSLHNSHREQLELFKRLRQVEGIKKIFIGSGLRYDMIVADKKYGDEYLETVIEHHISGQIKLAPEHSQPRVLELMGKPKIETLKAFVDKYYIINKEKGKSQFLTYYIIAAHPGCTDLDMKELKEYLNRELKANPEQVQVFTPTPGTWSGVMYYTETDPFTGEHVFVEKEFKGKERQKEILTGENRGDRGPMAHDPRSGSRRPMPDKANRANKKNSAGYDSGQKANWKNKGRGNF
jgi:uncharacterized radical SAM protein YgiQ